MPARVQVNNYGHAVFEKHDVVRFLHIVDASLAVIVTNTRFDTLMAPSFDC